MPITRAIQLQAGDASAYTVLRREMLTEAPWAFGSSVAEDRGLDVEGVAKSLGQPGYALVGVFEQSEGGGERRLIAVAGVRREERLKRQHAAGIFSVYVTPSARGRGHGRAVVEGAIAAARSWPGVEQVELCVSERADVARAMYLSLGFEAWGFQPCALKVGSECIAETHMTLRF